MFHPASHPILSCAEAKAWEAGLLKGEAAEWAAMQKAGAAIACALLGDLREIGGWTAQPRLLVLAGKGHNGGDALLAAAQLLAAVPNLQATILLAHGAPIAEILGEYHYITEDDVRACILFASKALNDVTFVPLAKEIA